jgi:hypothetical protein
MEQTEKRQSASHSLEPTHVVSSICERDFSMFLMLDVRRTVSDSVRLWHRGTVSVPFAVRQELNTDRNVTISYVQLYLSTIQGTSA